MGSVLSSWNSIILCVLFLLLVLILSAQDITARKVTVSRTKDYDHQADHGHMMDPSERIFFTIKDLRIGNSIPVYLSYKDPATSPHLLPRIEASSIPFSSSQLPYLLQFFSFSADSPQAKAMAYTLTECNLDPLEGESKFCATSLESMLDFARGVFGLDTSFKVLTTSFVTKPVVTSTALQNYTILELPEEIQAPKMVACHSMPYPYAVFYCHYQEGEKRLFRISLRGESYGGRVEAVAVCHMDTSQWNRDHASFRLLKIEPGTSPVCHFFPADNLVWVPELTAV